MWLLSVGDGKMLEISVPEDVNSHLVILETGHLHPLGMLVMKMPPFF